MSGEVITQGAVVTEAECTDEGFPQKLAGFIAEYGFSALTDWLDKNGAPKVIRELTEGLHGVVMVLEDSENGSIPETYDNSITDSLAKIGRGIHYTGITVHSPDSMMQL